MPDAHKNFIITNVASAPTPPTSGASLAVSAGYGAHFPAPPFNLTVWPSGEEPLAFNAEIVRVTAISTDTLTITRAQEGTTARSIQSGDQIAMTITAKTITDAENVVLAKQAAIDFGMDIHQSEQEFLIEDEDVTASSIIVGGVAYQSPPTNTYGAASDWEKGEVQVGLSPSCVAYGAGLFVAGCTASNFVITSADGLDWTSHAVGGGSSTWTDLIYGGGQFVMVSDSNVRVATSPDGINWTQQTPSENLGWQCVTFGNGLYVAGANTGTNRIMTSPDGITWTSRSGTSGGSWVDIAYGNGVYVAVGVSTKFIKSADGITWTEVTVTDRDYANIVYTGSQFVAAGNGYIATSPDGSTWTEHPTPLAESWRTSYGEGFLLLVGSGATFDTSKGNVLVSSDDGTTWVRRVVLPRDQPEVWANATYGGGKFVAVGKRGSDSRIIATPAVSLRALDELALEDLNVNMAAVAGGVIVSARSLHGSVVGPFLLSYHSRT